MGAGIDISLIGDKALERTFRRLEGTAQKRVMRKALRASAKRLKAHVVANVSGDPVGVRTGRYRQAIKKAKAKALPRSRSRIGVGLALPSRSELGISPEDPYFFPAVLEYGSDHTPAQPHWRPAVDEHKAGEFRLMGRDIGKGIEAEAKRK